MKILTANIAMGVPDSDSLFTNVRAFWEFGGSLMGLYFFLWLLRGRFLDALSKRIRLSFPPSARRTRYFSSHNNIPRLLALVRAEDPDVLVLNEVLRQFHQEELTRGLSALGFVSFAWNFIDYFPDMAFGTLVASKLLAEPFPASIRELPQWKSGSRTAGLRFRNAPLSVIGCHLDLAARELLKGQLDDLAALHAKEKNAGRSVVIAGDCNETAKKILAHPGFCALGFKSVTTQATCPLSFPQILRWDLDHIFIPTTWQVRDVTYPSFGSDHLAVAAEVTLSFR